MPPDLRRRLAALMRIDLVWLLGLAALVFLRLDVPGLVWPPLIAVFVSWVLVDLECAKGNAGAIAIRGVASLAGLVVSLLLVLHPGLAYRGLAAAGFVLAAAIGIVCDQALAASRARRVDPLLLAVFDHPRDAAAPPGEPPSRRSAAPDAHP